MKTTQLIEILDSLKKNEQFEKLVFRKNIGSVNADKSSSIISAFTNMIQVFNLKNNKKK